METNILFKKLSFAEIRDGLAIIHDEGELLFTPVPSPSQNAVSRRVSCEFSRHIIT